MGKRGNFRCIVEDCTKTGSLSAVRQHFRAAHPIFNGRFSSRQLEDMITRKETIAVPVTFTKDGELTDRDHRAARQNAFVHGLLAGLLISVLLGMIVFATIDCSADKASLCPASLQRLISGADGR